MTKPEFYRKCIPARAIGVNLMGVTAVFEPWFGTRFEGGFNGVCAVF